jgi:SAM-dependent methyltransferase
VAAVRGEIPAPRSAGLLRCSPPPNRGIRQHTTSPSDDQSNVKERAHGAELMDEPVLEPDDLRTALHDLDGVNRWLGGWRVLRDRFGELLRMNPPGRYSVLDVGTGGGDLPLRLSTWSRARDYELDILATDLHPQTLDVARARLSGTPGIHFQLADALRLPFEDRAFDFAICSTLLHHFATTDAVRAVTELARVSRRGIVVNDLRRSSYALLGARLLAVTVWRRSRFTRHDGPLSVRRAFTPDELHRIAALAGLDHAEIRSHHPFRISLTAARLDRHHAG